MRKFLVASVIALALAGCAAATAEAQLFRRGGYWYGSPSYYTYSTPTYSYYPYTTYYSTPNYNYSYYPSTTYYSTPNYNYSYYPATTYYSTPTYSYYQPYYYNNGWGWGWGGRRWWR
jgi:hypothetical protein